MTEFKVIGKDWGKNVIQHPDGTKQHVSDEELEALTNPKSAEDTEAEAKAKADAAAEVKAKKEAEAKAKADADKK